jgi:hypothetical protein
LNKLIVEPVNGLMNRFRCIASAKILAEYTNRELLINWKPEYICNVSLTDIVEDGFFNKGYDVNRNECYYHSGPEKLSEQPFVNDMINTEKETLYLLAGGNFIPTGMSTSEFNNKKRNFYKSIPFVDRIKNESNDFISKYKNYISIHLRYTDRKQWSPNIEYIEDIINNNEGNIFICSDDRGVINYLKSKFGQRILSYNITNLNRGSVDGSQQSMIEWLILANSEKIYYSLCSSYSYEACIYNKLSNSIEMNPNNIQLDDLKIKLEF